MLNLISSRLYCARDICSVLIGEGKMNFSNDHVNELVNPGQSLWKWRTVEDELRGI